MTLGRVLVTGATGSFGQTFVRRLLRDNLAERIRIYSRDEMKQYQMRRDLGEDPEDRVRYLLGDVRDHPRLRMAMRDCDVVVHAAALKIVPTLEYNVPEAVKTNIGGPVNIVEAASDCGVGRVVALSSDKATQPVNAYGATKLAMEKLLVAANAYTGRKVRFGCVRYGNVTGSRGSVVPLWRECVAKGAPLPVTDTRCTRFWISLDEAVDLVLYALAHMNGGEVWIPKLPSYRVVDLASAVAPGAPLVDIGLRGGEKLHESLIGPDEGHFAWDAGDVYALIAPKTDDLVVQPPAAATRVPDGFRYASDENTQWLGVEELRQRLGRMAA